ncbi:MULTISPECIES: hypothetical protein [Erwiniaceae]|uniref:Uncharacterized protein n=3 Tax=Erwiniaceae TaxID=1903409 RepID=A0A4U3F8R2_9GAMM|nr:MULTISPECIES: hypothetical protein [Erwiniaceae]MCQ8226429.1 hypothetical protein [Pantoea sp. MMK2]MCQ8238349.1 hypothetical protein [Pantoea sp. MMK3]TKJ88699.1 hypothetical protein EpCFBP13511_14810 [Erwinia persicina]
MNARILPEQKQSGAYTYFVSLVNDFEDTHYKPVIEASLNFSTLQSAEALQVVKAALETASKRLKALIDFVAVTADSKDFRMSLDEVKSLQAMLQDQVDWLGSEAMIVDDEIHQQIELAAFVVAEEAN